MNLEAIKDLPVEQLADRDCTFISVGNIPRIYGSHLR